MTKVEIASWAGYTNETYDCAIPLQWAQEVNKLDIEANNFIWHYPAGSNGGRPVPLGDLLIKAINNGNLVPINIVSAAIERARECPAESLEDILKLVKLSCQHI